MTPGPLGPGIRHDDRRPPSRRLAGDRRRVSRTAARSTPSRSWRGSRPGERPDRVVRVREV